MTTPWRRRTQQTLRTAALALDSGDAASACNRAYYAMFCAVRVALLAVGQKERGSGKTHSGIISAFNEFVVLPAFVPQEVGGLFGRELKRRVGADYDGDDLSTEDAIDALANARRFVDVVLARFPEDGH